MTKVEDIEKAVSALPPKDFARFREWFEAFEAARFDARIEQDARAGRLDAPAQAALDDLKAGRVAPPVTPAQAGAH
jgi:hypothetical protein